MTNNVIINLQFFSTVIFNFYFAILFYIFKNILILFFASKISKNSKYLNTFCYFQISEIIQNKNFSGNQEVNYYAFFYSVKVTRSQKLKIIQEEK